jgi:SAM-dependent methyltransferase
MSIRAHNRAAWDQKVTLGCEWTVPVDSAVIEEARCGRWHIVLTPTKAIPADWMGAVPGKEVLCLASGGGQQGPVLAAAGAKVTVLDNSPRQLEQDRSVARRDSLRIETVEGDMADLSMFADRQFDLIVHPVSNTFVPDVRPVWREAFRVLRPGGVLLAGFVNPVAYLFDERAWDEGRLEVRNRLPYSDAESLSPAQRQQRLADGQPLEFSHTLESQIGGQIEAGFVITGFYEDSCPPSPRQPLAEFMPMCIATRGEKLSRP